MFLLDPKLYCYIIPGDAELVRTLFDTKLSHLRHSQGYLTAGMLHAEGFPCLTIKAHNGRLMLVFLDLCLATYIKSTRDADGTPSSEVVNASLATRALCGWFDAVERAGRYLTRAEADTIYNYGFSFLKTYQRLGVESVLNGSRRWKYIPKLHVVHHLLEDMKFSLVNCRFTHCFKDEDNVGLVKRLAVRVHKGNLFEYRILTRWLLRLDTWRP